MNPLCHQLSSVRLLSPMPLPQTRLLARHIKWYNIETSHSPLRSWTTFTHSILTQKTPSLPTGVATTRVGLKTERELAYYTSAAGADGFDLGIHLCNLYCPFYSAALILDLTCGFVYYTSVYSVIFVPL